MSVKLKTHVDHCKQLHSISKYERKYRIIYIESYIQYIIYFKNMFVFVDVIGQQLSFVVKT